jgi:hypothetical protein
MKKLFVAFFALFIGVFTAYADHEDALWSPTGLPVDDYRGPWFATIDLEAQDWAWKRQTDIVRKGETALRFELRDGDCFTAMPHAPEEGWDDCTLDRERTEIREKWYPELNKNVWYAFSMMIPDDYVYMYPKQIFFQTHTGRGPNVYFQLDREQFKINILTEEGVTTTLYEIGELPKGVWLDFAINAVWSADDDGKLYVYLDRKRILRHRGPTIDIDTQIYGRGPFAKFGIYRSHLFRWESEEPHPTQVLYFDEYRRGYEARDIDIREHEGD